MENLDKDTLSPKHSLTEGHGPKRKHKNFPFLKRVSLPLWRELEESSKRYVLVLCFLACLSAGLVIYFSLFSYHSYRQELIQTEQEQLLTMAKTVGKSLVSYIRQELDSIDLYFSSLEFSPQADDKEGIRQKAYFFLEQNRDLYDAMACYDSYGNLLFQEGIMDFSFSEISLENQASVCGKKLTPQRWYQMFISRRFSCNGADYQIVYAMNLNQIYNQIVAPVQIGQGGYSIVKDSNLLIIMHHAADQIGIDAVYDRSRLYQQLDLTDLFSWISMQQTQPEGCSVINSYIWNDPALPPEKRIVAYTTISIPGEEWIVNSTLPFQELNQPLNRMLLRLGGMSTLFLLFLSFFIYTITRMLVRADVQHREIDYLKEINKGMELLRHKEEEIQHYQRMQSIGQMSSHIAHEFNNYLTPVMIYGEILESDNTISPQNQELIHGIIGSVNQAAALSRKLLNFSRQDNYGILINQDLTKEAIEASQVICRMAPENVTVCTQFPQVPFPVLGNKGMMNHLLLNLCNNAFHAMEGKEGILTLRLSKSDNTKLNLKGEWAVLSVSDTGCGIKSEALDKIFEPFYTTKRSGKGTGLGLSVVLNVMQAVNGHVDIESEVGVGTTFYLYFPLVSPSAPTDSVKSRKIPNKLVIVDDDPELLKSLRLMLKSSSIDAEYYDHPAAVLSRIQNEKDYCDVILTDYAMPSVNGLELAEIVRRLNSQIRLILMSGSDSSQFDWYLKNAIIDDFLPKTEISEKLMDLILG